MVNASQKIALRDKYRRLRDGFDLQTVEDKSKTACGLLLESREFAFSDTVLLYYPIKNEISPLPILKIAQDSGKTVAFPVCDKEHGRLLFRKVSDINDLSPSSFGLFEPDGRFEEVIPNERTLCVVPALLFSRNGHRLGYGAGYYDRFLLDFRGISAGLSYSELVVDELPSEAHDVPLKMLVTESEVLYFA